MITVLSELKGMKKADYEDLHETMVASGAAPVGRIFHIASEGPDGMLVVEVWESPEKLQATAGLLAPVIQQMGFALGEPRVLATVAAFAET